MTVQSHVKSHSRIHFEVVTKSMEDSSKVDCELNKCLTENSSQCKSKLPTKKPNSLSSTNIIKTNRKDVDNIELYRQNVICDLFGDKNLRLSSHFTGENKHASPNIVAPINYKPASPENVVTDDKAEQLIVELMDENTELKSNIAANTKATSILENVISGLKKELAEYKVRLDLKRSSTISVSTETEKPTNVSVGHSPPTMSDAVTEAYLDRDALNKLEQENKKLELAINETDSNLKTNLSEQMRLKREIFKDKDNISYQNKIIESLRDDIVTLRQKQELYEKIDHRMIILQTQLEQFEQLDYINELDKTISLQERLQQIQSNLAVSSSNGNAVKTTHSSFEFSSTQISSNEVAESNEISVRHGLKTNRELVSDDSSIIKDFVNDKSELLECDSIQGQQNQETNTEFCDNTLDKTLSATINKLQPHSIIGDIDELEICPVSNELDADSNDSVVPLSALSSTIDSTQFIHQRRFNKSLHFYGDDLEMNLPFAGPNDPNDRTEGDFIDELNQMSLSILKQSDFAGISVHHADTPCGFEEHRQKLQAIMNHDTKYLSSLTLNRRNEKMKGLGNRVKIPFKVSA